MLADLTARYREPWRAYHTLAHVEAMLAEFDEFRQCDEFQLVNPDAIRMAIWYHDAVYDTRAKDNEAKSADLFRRAVEHSGLSESFVGTVVRLILATTHTAPPADLDARVLCDIDLAILGQPEAVFDEYERQIRQEYGWVSEELFRKGRAAILQRFLDRPEIYSTDYFRRKYEAQARRNLARSVERLSELGR
jgi:predicted metal-dependent HD superfamily phosphohydrolase